MAASNLLENRGAYCIAVFGKRVEILAHSPREEDGFPGQECHASARRWFVRRRDIDFVNDAPGFRKDSSEESKRQRTGKNKTGKQVGRGG